MASRSFNPISHYHTQLTGCWREALGFLNLSVLYNHCRRFAAADANRRTPPKSLFTEGVKQGHRIRARNSQWGAPWQRRLRNIPTGASSRSRMDAMVTTEKASLISQRSMSLALRPALSRASLAASTGAVVNQSGSWAKDAWLTILPRGFTPRDSAFSADVTTNAAAPSLILDAFAAVTVPCLSKAGRSRHLV